MEYLGVDREKMPRHTPLYAGRDQFLAGPGFSEPFRQNGHLVERSACGEIATAVESPAFWRYVIDQLPAGVLILDQSGTISHWNAWLADKTGISASRAVGRTLPELFPGFDNPRFISALGEVVAGGPPQVMSQALNRFLVPIELRGRDASGPTLMPQKVQLAPLRMANLPLSVMVSIIDVTDSVDRANALLGLVQSFKEKSDRDPLTGLYNRGFLADWLDRQLKFAARRGDLLSCLMIDIDRFKRINDTHGHLVGDQVIKGLASVILSRVRDSDIVVRYGGEEFAVLMPSCALSDGLTRARRILEDVRASVIGPLGSGALTCSVGVAAARPGEGRTGADLLDDADKQLYLAKAAGGNRVLPELE